MNLGLAAAQSGDHRLALQAWSRYHEMVPNDTKAFGKIIQACQALGECPSLPVPPAMPTIAESAIGAASPLLRQDLVG